MESIPGNFQADSDLTRILEANKSLILTAESQYLSESSGYSVKIIELMLITAIVGVMISFTTSHGLVGVLMLFLCASALSILSLRFSRNPAQIRFWNQAIWGIIMPIACLINDPYLISTFDHGKLISINKSIFFGCCVVLASGFAFLMISWVCPPRAPAFLNGLVAGVLFSNGVLISSVGLCALPAVVLTLPALVGIAGLVPWISAVVYFRTSALNFRMGCVRSKKISWLAAIFAVLLCATAFVSFNFMAADGYFDSLISKMLQLPVQE